MTTDPSQHNRTAYDQIAPRYAERNAAMLPYIITAAQTFLSKLPPSGLILDLGCGAGRDTAWFEAQGARITGGDLSRGMLDQARRIVTAPLTQLNMLTLPFADGSVAGVWCQAALLHLPKALAPEALREARRVIAPGGVLHVSVQRGETEGFEVRPYEPEERYYAHYTPEELPRLLTGAGFRVLHMGEDQARRPWVWAICDIP